MGGTDYFDFVRKVFTGIGIFEKDEALKGVRVLDVTAVVLGPSASDMLAEFGAEVIKFEPAHGDQMRFVTPFAYFYKNMSLGLWEQQHNRYWVGMHLGNPKAKELFLEFVKKADVVIDNLTPGRMAEWGLDYSVLSKVNPKIIQLHVSGFGSWGPWTGRTSYDAIAQSMGGLAYITGFEDRGPIKSGVWIADWINGLMCALSIVIALNYRERTGKGQFIDQMQVENIIRMMDWTWLYCYITGKNRARSGNRDLAICPSDMFEAKDGWVAVAAFTEEEFKGLCESMGRMDLFEEYKDPLVRLKDENARKLLGEIAKWVKEKHVEEIIRLADKYGFSATEILEVDDVYHSCHFNERKAIQEYEDELFGYVKEQAYPPRMSETPSRVKWGPRPIGFDNEYVFNKILGLSLDEIKKLYDEGVIYRWNDAVPSTCPPPDWDGTSGLKYPFVK